MKEKSTMTIKFRLTPSEFKKLHARANRYTSGNVSEFIKQAISDYKLKKRPHRSEAKNPSKDSK